ncbi:hypothetical protein CTE07_43110 [Chitinophaga terrae (ex Kim and Jung 2007)]|nr:hypothetical protein CTE07_43110 [Chitinophaga terrae (ex Kim and Jung 2007)]
MVNFFLRMVSRQTRIWYEEDFIKRIDVIGDAYSFSPDAEKDAMV